jgi:microcystin-dependent protein
MPWASITYTFSPSTMAKASEVNQNFADLVANVNKAMPSGGIIIWANSIVSIPSGWYLCDGANGTPNLVGQYVQGAGAGYPVGNIGGEATHILTTPEMPTHNHADLGHAHGGSWWENVGGGSSTDDVGSSNVNARSNTMYTGYANIQNTGGGGAHNNLPPFTNLAFIMKS